MRRDEKFYKATTKKGEKVLIHEINTFMDEDELGLEMYKRLLYVRTLFNSKSTADYIIFNNWDQIREEYENIEVITKNKFDLMVINSFCLEKLFNGENLNDIDIENFTMRFPVLIKSEDLVDAK